MSSNILTKIRITRPARGTAKPLRALSAPAGGVMRKLSADTYIREAMGLANAVDILCHERNESTLYSIGMLAGHCLELALKGFLISQGLEESELKKIGHKLSSCWSSCNDMGLELGEFPYWVQVIDYSHSNNFYYRYPQDDHIVGVPDIDKLPSEIGKVLSTIGESLERC